MPAYTNCELAQVICDLLEKVVALEAAVAAMTPPAQPFAVAIGGTGSASAVGARVNLNINTSIIASGTTAIDWRANQTFFEDIIADKTYTFTNVDNGLGVHLKIANSIGFTPTFPTSIDWVGAVAQPDVPGVGEYYVYSLVAINGVISGTFAGPFDI